MSFSLMLQDDKCRVAGRARSSGPITTRRAWARHKSKPSSCPATGLEPALPGQNCTICRCCDVRKIPRIAYVHFAPGLAFMTFSADSGPLPVWRGTEMQAGDTMFHGRGERLHQCTPGPSSET